MVDFDVLASQTLNTIHETGIVINFRYNVDVSLGYKIP